ncbi:MAG: peptidase M14 [Chloroflexota bacterium]|nr:MAG: peptidase M14 [Chloroflexota bacterium]
MSTRNLLSLLILLGSIIPAMLFPTSSFGIEQESGQSREIVRIYFDDVTQLNQLSARYDIWEVDHTSGYILAYVSPIEFSAIESLGLRLETDPDLNASLHKIRELLPGQISGIPGYPCYRTVEETYVSLTQLSNDYPQLTMLVDIGDSWEKSTFGEANGYDLQTLVLTNKNKPGQKPKFYLIAAVHAREYATAELALRFAEYLLANYDQDPDVTWLLDYFEIHITPYGNPDGRKIAENGIYWRKNTNNSNGCSDSSLWGTDLNRNSSFKWGGVGASPNSCDETFSGSSAASEPETQSIQNYAASLFPDQRGPGDSDPASDNSEGIFITLHSYGELVLYPWGWTNSPSPNDASFETLGRKFGYFTSYQVCRSGGDGCLYQTSGTNDDWVYGELGVASFTFELGTQFFESCSYFENSILDKNINALLYAFKAARRPYQNPAGPDSIDISLSAEKIAPGAGVSLVVIADDTRYDSGGWGSEPDQNINAGRYSIDKPSWGDGSQTYPLSPVDGSFDNSVESLSGDIDTASLTPGRHTIFIESQDANGNWGVTSAKFFWITGENFQPELSPAEIQGRGTSGSLVPYLVRVRNIGTMDDSFDLRITGNNWEIAPLPGSTGPLAPMESQDIWVHVTIPGSAAVGDQDMAILNAVSKSDSTKYAITEIKTTARQPEIYLPTISK